MPCKCTTAEVARLREALEVAEDALERARACVWDRHYGNGLSPEYARAVSGEINAALARIAALKKPGGPA